MRKVKKGGLLRVNFPSKTNKLKKSNKKVYAYTVYFFTWADNESVFSTVSIQCIIYIFFNSEKFEFELF